MRIVGASSSSGTGRPDGRRRPAQGRRRQADDQAEPVRNLPATRHAPGAGAPRPGSSYAPLVAQLIATSLDLPQTRQRRRASPAAAMDAYGAAPAPAAPARLLRSV